MPSLSASWPYVVAVLFLIVAVASALTRLTRHPEVARGAGGALRAIQGGLGFLSAMEHAGVGGWKLPLTAAQVSEAERAVAAASEALRTTRDESNKVPALLPVLFLPALALGSAVLSCTTVARREFTVTFTACSADKLPEMLQRVEAEVEQLLLSGASKEEIRQVGKKEGILLAAATIECLVQAAVAALQHRTDSEPRAAEAVLRGQTILEETSP